MARRCRKPALSTSLARERFRCRRAPGTFGALELITRFRTRVAICSARDAQTLPIGRFRATRFSCNSGVRPCLRNGFAGDIGHLACVSAPGLHVRRLSIHVGWSQPVHAWTLAGAEYPDHGIVKLYWRWLAGQWFHIAFALSLVAPPAQTEHEQTAAPKGSSTSIRLYQFRWLISYRRPVVSVLFRIGLRIAALVRAWFVRHSGGGARS